ncbi:tetratricopeptide repeat protein [Humisphaera borealis]|uniref:Tetratricopeptide repeat protein n=1 Tax=Humisphaera borealis TaxID=2807512 RepID=A0A7M2X1G3_9BACT|nr:tetratricopeptide repeat protein [Humisphaera borealis]QOV90971.1 tetratricopeptide repeat protein [Humisphaera borealis]
MTPNVPTRSHPSLAMTIALLALLLSSFVGGCAPESKPPAGDSISKAKADNEAAVLLIEKAKYTEAEPLLRSALASDPGFGQARNNLGLVYYHTGNLYQAAWEFEEAARLMPRRPEPHNNLGLVYERANQLIKAVDAYTEAYKLDPAGVEYLANLARARVRRGDTDVETRRLLQELIMKDARPQWNEWARSTLIRLNAVPPLDLTTKPS